MKEGEVKKLLEAFVSEYKAAHGDSKAMLSSWTFDHFAFSSSEALQKRFLSMFGDSFDHEELTQALEELRQRGYSDMLPNGDYVLTPYGLKKGGQGRFYSVIDFLNLNPGLNTLIAVLALIVSLCALWVSLAKP
ncbi:hypothetical protein [Teredinibacter turnerae]|uniref:hypothetical protein n=1 Tax=Teredinibacter turnerae TaxID=2426 RepID=UPI0003A0110C|nr:hypothetical protein [Teredinibacter turnerae]